MVKASIADTAAAAAASAPATLLTSPRPAYAFIVDALASTVERRKKGEIDDTELTARMSAMCDTYDVLFRNRYRATALHILTEGGGDSHSVVYLFDTGANAHLTNTLSVYVPNSIRSCAVDVVGINDDDPHKRVTATQCGDVEYEVCSGVVKLLRGVLYLPGAVLGVSDADVSTPTVLVSGSKFVCESGLGLHFPAGGGVLEFTSSDRVIGKFHTHTHFVY